MNVDFRVKIPTLESKLTLETKPKKCTVESMVVDVVDFWLLNCGW
jgi:hypothetical protein